MSKFLTRERFGRPQVLAGFLLLGFLAQCGWLLVRGTEPAEIESSQLFRVVEGLQQWSGESVAGTPSVERMEAGTPTPPEIEQNDGYDPNHSPLWYLLASVPLLGWTGTSESGSFHYWGWLARTPYLIFGLLLGASRVEQLEQNLAACEKGPVPAEVLKVCDEVWTNLRSPVPIYNR